jgi:hypothetical protein
MVAKSASIIAKKKNSSQFLVAYHKMQNLMLILNPLKKVQKIILKYYSLKTFAPSKNQKLHFSVTFS